MIFSGRKRGNSRQEESPISSKITSSAFRKDTHNCHRNRKNEQGVEHDDKLK
jgi:hypothetical protein